MMRICALERYLTSSFVLPTAWHRPPDRAFPRLLAVVRIDLRVMSPIWTVRSIPIRPS